MENPTISKTFEGGPSWAPDARAAWLDIPEPITNCDPGDEQPE